MASRKNNLGLLLTLLAALILTACEDSANIPLDDEEEVNESTPATPTNLIGSASADSISLSWDAVSNASSYKVYRDNSLLVPVTSNSFSESGLNDGTYLYKVAAVNASGASSDTASISITVDESSPHAPTNLTATVSGDSVSLSWDAADSASSYKVYRSNIFLISVSSNSFSESGLEDGAYLYEVTSVNISGESTSKASVSVTIDTSLPNAPTNLTATVSGDSVDLSWGTVSDATSYKVYRDGSLLGSVNTNSFNDSGLADATYTYEVSSVGKNGESTSAASVSATIYTSPPNAPSRLTATVNGDSVALSWDTVSDATSYKVYRDGSLLGSVSSNSFNDSGLNDGTYTYEVSSVGDNGESASTASVSATVYTSLPNAPTNLTATVNGDSVTLSWNAVSDANSYKVYRDGSLLGSVNTNSFNDSGLADSTYTYEVSSVGDNGESAGKASVSATVYTALPNAPTNLTATVSGDSVALSWDAVNDATSYKVYRDGSLLGSVNTNSFNESGLADGTYTYEVSSVSNNGESASTASVNATVYTALPNAPTNLTATVSGDSVALSWNAVSDATSYKVYRDGSLLGSVSINSFTDSGLADGTYTYEISSVGNNGESASTASVSATVYTSLPSAPTNLTATVSGDSVALSWSAVSNATSYKVYRDGSLLGSVNTNSFSDSGLADGTYTYEVSSVGANGESASTASVSATIDTAPPNTPSGLTATVNGDSVALSWSAVSNATSYKVYRDGSLLGSVSSNSFNDSGLADGTYTYEVSSVSNNGESASTASVSATVYTSLPNAPTNLTATVSGDSVALSWDTVSNATSYKVYRDGSLLGSVSSNSFNDSGLADGTYTYEVSSVSNNGESASTASVSATVYTALPNAPTNLTATVSGDSIALSWDAVSDATSYKVYRDGSLLGSVSSNSFNDSGLADGTYLYEVNSVSNNGESASTASVNATVYTALPNAPTNLTATVSGDSVALSWNAVSDATSYKVYRDGSLLGSVSINSFTDSGLADGTYTYEISSVGNNGESASTASVSATVYTSLPSAPTNLTATVSGDSVALSWSAVSNATSYKVYRDGSLLGSVNTNSFSDSGLADGTYTYEVSSVGANGESASTASVSATIDTAPPNTPSGLTATVNGDSVALSWDAVSNATSYKVYRDGSLLGSVSSNSFNDSGLADGTYTYEVSSVSNNGESASTASVSATVYTSLPNAPTNLTATVSGDSVALSWDAVSDAINYKVYRDGSLLGTVSSNSFTDSGLADGAYTYEVTAVNTNGESTSAASVSATVYTSLPNAPTGLAAMVNGDYVILNWDAVSDASSYNVYRDSSLLSSVSSNSFIDSSLADGMYLYEVTAVDAAGESTSRASANVTVAIDPLYSHQWHLENTGQDAFATLNGSIGEDINHSGALALGVNGAGVRINVIDTGLEIQHPDLQASIVAGGSYNYLDGGTDPTNTTDTDGDHGTSVAGLIAAVSNNGIGISGVAGAAELQGYNYLAASSTTYSDYIFAHGGDDDLENTDIFNKSLGSSPTSDSRLYSGMLDALSCYTTGGSTDMSSSTAASSCGSALRSGLGAIYVKSAGNNFSADGSQVCDSLDLTCWNVNMESEETYPYQIIVGALNAQGEKSSYSSAGSAIWISAPGGEYGWDHEYFDSELDPYGYAYNTSYPDSTLWQPALVTIDQVGCNRGYTTDRYDFNLAGVPPIGYTSFHEDASLNSNCEYTSTFNGTSSAAPVTSGVVALMLDANSSLSWRDVKHILASSARQVDSGAAALEAENVVCTNSSCSSLAFSSSLSFVVRDAWITNAAGYKYHNWYGFGAVNAGAAVAMALDYASPLGTWQKKSYQLSPSIAIPDSTGASAIATITVPDALSVEAVQLDLDIDHSCIFELAVVLHSPSGTRSVLLTPYNQFNCDQDFSSTLLSNAFYGESAVGDWTVEIYDIWETSAGTLDDVSLNIYGH